MAERNDSGPWTRDDHLLVVRAGEEAALEPLGEACAVCGRPGSGEFAGLVLCWSCAIGPAFRGAAQP
jgi:hypothetical protein